MGFFKPEVERVLKALGVLALVGLVVLPMGFAYEQRRQARAWQSVACAYQMREVSRRTPLVRSGSSQQDPCLALNRLGLELELGPSSPPSLDAGRGRQRLAASP
jgi:hypothetical protein